MDKAKRIGWATALNRWHDEGVTSHLLVDKGDGFARAACGVAPYSFGQVTPGPSRAVCGSCWKARKSSAP